MQYARISMIVAVEDDAASALSEVLRTIDTNSRIIILEHHQDDMYLLTEEDAREAGGDHVISLSSIPPSSSINSSLTDEYQLLE